MTYYGFSKLPQERYDSYCPMEDLIAQAGTLQLRIFNLLIS